MKMTRWMILVLMALKSTALGCQSTHSTELVLITESPTQVTLSDNGVAMDEGIVVAALVVPRNDGVRMVEGTVLELIAEDAEILRINRLEQPDNSGDNGDWHFTFAGAQAGQTEFDFVINGESEGRVPVVVREASP